MFIKKLKPNVYDIFVGTQWDQWTRVQRVGDNLKFIAGQFLSRADLATAKARLVRK